MARFLVFAGSHYYPSGGWDDFIGARDSMDAALALLVTDERASEADWKHIVDAVELRKVWDSLNGFVQETGDDSE